MLLYRLNDHRTLFADGAAAAATARCAFCFLLGNLRHRQVAFSGDAAAAPAALVDPGDLGDVGEQVGDVDQVRAGVAAEADDLDADAHLLDGADGAGEVTVARHDDRDVEVARRLHHVDDELDVEVRLDAAVAVLADVLADDLVAVPRQEGVELALVVVLRVQPGVCVGADEIASGGGRLEQRDVIDVHAGRLGRVEDVRHVHEDGDVLAHKVLLFWLYVRSWRAVPIGTAPRRERVGSAAEAPPRQIQPLPSAPTRPARSGRCPRAMSSLCCALSE